MRWWLLVVAVGACDAGEKPSVGPRPDEVVQAELAKRPPAKRPPKPPQQPPLLQFEAPSPPIAIAQAELDAVARAVLVRYEGKHDTVPDEGLIAGKPLYVKANLGYPCPPDAQDCVEDRRMLTAAAMPSAKFQLRTRDQLQADATRTNDNVYYIDITGVEIKGAEATLTVGVDFVMPDASGGKLCCCSATQVWTKKNGSWKYTKTTMQICS